MNRPGPRSVLAALAAALLPAAPARAGTAFDQLCAAAGSDCARVPEPPPPTRVDPPSRPEKEREQQQAPAPRPKPKPSQEQQLKLMVTGTLMEALLGAVFAPPPGQDAAAAEAERQRRLEELRRRAEHIRGQRESREQENEAGLEEMRSSLAEPFDMGPARPVRLDPGAGRVALFAPPENPFLRREPPKPPSEAAQRLAAIAAENADVATLQLRLTDLEAQLAAERLKALDLKRASNAVVREYQTHEETVTRTVEEAKDRGASLALDRLLKLEPKALEALEEVRSNKPAWNTMTGLLRGGHDMAEAAEKVNDGVGDARWLMQQRDLKADLKYLGERFGGDYYKYGSSIVESAVACRQQVEALKAMRQLEGVTPKYRAELAQVSERMKELQKPLRETREALSRATGIAVNDLPRAPSPTDLTAPSSLAKPVPHPLDNP